MSTEKGNQQHHKISIRLITAGIEVNLKEVINLRGYENGDTVRTKTRDTTWSVHPDIPLSEVMKLCVKESVFNDDYGRREV